MPFLALGGTTVPVRMEPVSAETRHFGDEAEAWDGTGLSRRRALKREWRCTTPWLTLASAATIRALLVGTPPVAATGDLTGSIDVIPTLTNEPMSTFAGGERRKMFEFLLREV